MKSVKFFKEKIAGLTVGRAIPKDFSNKIPLLLVHGMWGNYRHWIRWVVALSENREVFAINLRGHDDDGRKTSGLSLEDYLFDLRKLLDETGEVIIIGHSMGALLAQKLAEEDGRVRGIVLLCSSPPRGIMLRGRVLRKIWKYIPKLISGEAFSISRKDFAELMLNRIPNYKNIILESGRAARDIALGSVKIGRLAKPILLIAGTQDKLTPLSLQKAIAEKFGVVPVVFKTGHMPMLESGGRRIPQTIKRWLDNI